MGHNPNDNAGQTPAIVVHFNAPVTVNFGSSQQRGDNPMMDFILGFLTGDTPQPKQAWVEAEKAAAAQVVNVGQTKGMPDASIDDADKHPEATDESVKQAVANPLTPEKEEQWEAEVEHGVKRLLKETDEPAGFNGSVTKEWLRNFAEKNGFDPLSGSQLYGVFGRDGFCTIAAKRGVELPLGDNDGYRPEDVIAVAKLGDELAADKEARTFGPGLNELLQKVAIRLVSNQQKRKKK